jgi:hypothetical protein
VNSALAIHPLHFAFTITFHYLFPQLTLRLALLIVVLKVLALSKSDESQNNAARFWARIFAINFAVGVVTGISMEFQFGTNWATISKATGDVNKIERIGYAAVDNIDGSAEAAAVRARVSSARDPCRMMRNPLWQGKCNQSDKRCSAYPTDMPQLAIAFL